MPKMFASRSLQRIRRPFKASSRLSSSAQQNQQPSPERDVRPATAQMGRLTDIGARCIFTSEQVTLEDCADRCMQDMFREVVRKFMREQVAPQQPAFEEAGQPDREVWKALGAMVGAPWKYHQLGGVCCRGC